MWIYSNWQNQPDQQVISAVQTCWSSQSVLSALSSVAQLCRCQFFTVLDMTVFLQSLKPVSKSFDSFDCWGGTWALLPVSCGPRSIDFCSKAAGMEFFERKTSRRSYYCSGHSPSRFARDSAKSNAWSSLSFAWGRLLSLLVTSTSKYCVYYFALILTRLLSLLVDFAFSFFSYPPVLRICFIGTLGRAGEGDRRDLTDLSSTSVSRKDSVTRRWSCLAISKCWNPLQR